MKLVGRAAAYIERLAIAAENLGTINALRLFARLRFHAGKDEHVLHVPRLKRKIYFRGAIDKGVMSHFFIPGYRIIDTPAQPARFIVDAGANIGDETIRFRYFHPQATIMAIEPDPANFRILQKNAANDPGIIPMMKGLWSHECNLQITPGLSNEAFIVSEVPSGSGMVQAISIDSILASPLNNGERFAEIDILKLDIEGAEYQIFSKNFEPWIHKVKVFIVECSDNEHPGTIRTVFRALSTISFHTHLCGENLVFIRDDVPWKLEVSAYLN